MRDCTVQRSNANFISGALLGIIWRCLWKHRATETWDQCTSCSFQITNVSVANVSCLNQCSLLHVQNKTLYYFKILHLLLKSYICCFLISWISMWYWLIPVVAVVSVKNWQWLLKAILNVACNLVLKQEWIFRYHLLVLRLRSPSEGFCSQPANLSPWLLQYMTISFLLQFKLMHLVILPSPTNWSLLLCNEIITSFPGFLFYMLKPHFSYLSSYHFYCFFHGQFQGDCHTLCSV